MRAARRAARRVRDERGLTLIELLVVMVILGLFSTIVYQAFFPQVDKAKIETAQTQMEIVALALDSYRLGRGVPGLPRGARAVHGAAVAGALPAEGQGAQGPLGKRLRLPARGRGHELRALLERRRQAGDHLRRAAVTDRR